MGIARSNLFYFDLYRPGILTYSALAIGVEKDAFEEDKAFGLVAKICLSRNCRLNTMRNLKPNGHSVSKI